MATDHQSQSNIQAVTKGRLLLESGRVEACSFKVDGGQDVFLTGTVAAAMKKKISYNYKVRVAASGEIVNSDCECPAGKGPCGTCKHVASVLLMISQFVETGSLAIRNSCTENLQTFHKPKKNYQGSPVKADDIPSKSLPNMDDPRPAQYRSTEGYNAAVRSEVINYCSRSSKDLGFRYLMSKASIQVAAVDHDYLQLPMTEHWVDNGIQVSSVDACREIEATTRKQRLSRRWHYERRWRLTSSRFGDICKATDRRNKEKLSKSLLSSIRLTSPAIIHGQSFESAAIKEFEREHSVKVHGCGLYVDSEHNFLATSPDGITNQGDLVEVKCPYNGRNDVVSVGSHFPYLFEDEDGHIHLKQNHSYYYQIQGQLNICKKETCFFVVYTFKGIFVEKIVVDQAFWSGSMLPKLELFYHKYYRKFVAGKL